MTELVVGDVVKFFSDSRERVKIGVIYGKQKTIDGHVFMIEYGKNHNGIECLRHDEVTPVMTSDMIDKLVGL